MTGDQTIRPGPATDRRRIGVWENEGRHLAVRDPAATEAPAPADDTVDAGRPALRPPRRGSDSSRTLRRPHLPSRSDGAVHALLDECSHGQVALSDGDVANGVVECWLHGSSFDLATGVPTGPPAIVPVPVYPVRVVADVIEVAI